MQRFELIIAAVSNDEEELLRLAEEAIKDYRHNRNEKTKNNGVDHRQGWEWRLTDKQRRKHLPRDLR